MMKIVAIVLFLMTFNTLFSQKKEFRDFETNITEIEISAIGLDDIVIENATSKYIEVVLFAKNNTQQEIGISEKNNKILINFQLDSLATDEAVFRKFITKRLDRAYAIIKIPKGKNITLFGDNHSIECKDFYGDISVYIEKGIVKLNRIQSNATVKMYAGTIYAMAKNTNINLHSNIGNIHVDNILYQKDFQRKVINSPNNISMTTIKGIIFVTTQ